MQNLDLLKIAGAVAAPRATQALPEHASVHAVFVVIIDGSKSPQRPSAAVTNARLRLAALNRHLVEADVDSESPQLIRQVSAFAVRQQATSQVNYAHLISPVPAQQTHVI